MSNNVIVQNQSTTSSYVIRVDSVASSNYTYVRYASSQKLLEELVNYFGNATKIMRRKRQALFQ